MSSKILKDSQKKSPWDEAIQDAQNELVTAMSRVAELKEAIISFQKSKERGDPWPVAKNLPATHN